MPFQLLHKAVIEEDAAKLRLFREDRFLKAERDERGFTAIELAYYLGKSQCLRILREWNPCKLKIYPRDGLAPLEYHEAEIEELLGFRYVPTMVFPTLDFFIKTLYNYSWFLKFTPLGSEGDKLGRTYWMGVSSDVAVKWIDEDIGYGLYNETAISEGTIIGEYTGVIRTVSRENPDPNGYCVQYPTRWGSKDTIVIDAKEQGNAMRFVNHSDCPNLRSVWALERGLLHLLFLANQAIPAQSQLTINYGPDYWQFRNKHPL